MQEQAKLRSFFLPKKFPHRSKPQIPLSKLSIESPVSLKPPDASIFLQPSEGFQSFTPESNTYYYLLDHFHFEQKSQILGQMILCQSSQWNLLFQIPCFAQTSRRLDSSTAFREIPILHSGMQYLLLPPCSLSFRNAIANSWSNDTLSNPSCTQGVYNQIWSDLSAVKCELESSLVGVWSFLETLVTKGTILHLL